MSLASLLLMRMFYLCPLSSLPPSKASSTRAPRRGLRCLMSTNPFERQSPKVADVSKSCRDPQIFSCVLEYLYKGDYYPRLLYNKRRVSFELEDAQDAQNLGGRGSVESTVDIPGAGGALLKDTVIYCAAERYGLDELKRLALRKQGLQSGITVDVILRSARYAYDNTPDSDSKLRAHYLALIIRSRKTFKRSGMSPVQYLELRTRTNINTIKVPCKWKWR